MIIQKVNSNIDFMSKTKREKKFNAGFSQKGVSFADLNLMLPCDAKKMINQKKISFKGGCNLTRLSASELEKLKASVESRVRNLGISTFEITRSRELNFATQAIDRLLKHKLMELNENLIYEIDKIATKLKASCTEKLESEAVLDFADFLVSDSIKMILDNKSVNRCLGNIFLFVSQYDIDAKQDFIVYLLNHPEVLAKNKNWGDLISSVNDNTIQDIIDNINNPFGTFRRNKTDTTITLYETDKGVVPSMQKVELEKVTPKVDETKPKGFARIGGQTKAIETIQRKFIYPKKYPELYQGIQPEKGAILYGPPGTGKSLLAQALSEESDSYFVKIGASDMSEKWVGSSQENWRNLFDDLRRNQPAILFIDEADALCKKRGKDVHGDKELNQFLKLMSDLNLENIEVFVLMATNNLEAFDEAVLRDGRFGTHIEMLPPQNEKEVEAIFNIYAKRLKLDNNVFENKSKIFKKMLELKLTGSAIEGVLKNSHEQALLRLGLFDKMEAKTMTPEDVTLFSIKLEDILASLEQRDKIKKRSIGF